MTTSKKNNIIISAIIRAEKAGNTVEADRLILLTYKVNHFKV